MRKLRPKERVTCSWSTEPELKPVSFIPCCHSFFSVPKHVVLLVYPRVPDTVAELMLGAQQTPMTIVFGGCVDSAIYKAELLHNTIDIVI